MFRIPMNFYVYLKKVKFSYDISVFDKAVLSVLVFAVLIPIKSQPIQPSYCLEEQVPLVQHYSNSLHLVVGGKRLCFMM